jgi:hypothetical protein
MRDRTRSPDKPHNVIDSPTPPVVTPRPGWPAAAGEDERDSYRTGETFLHYRRELSGNPTVIYNLNLDIGNSNIEVYVRGADGAPWEDYWNWSTLSWSGWRSFGGSLNCHRGHRVTPQPNQTVTDLAGRREEVGGDGGTG